MAGERSSVVQHLGLCQDGGHEVVRVRVVRRPLLAAWCSAVV